MPLHEAHDSDPTHAASEAQLNEGRQTVALASTRLAEPCLVVVETEETHLLFVVCRHSDEGKWEETRRMTGLD